MVHDVFRFPKMIKVKGVTLQPYGIVREAVDCEAEIDPDIATSADAYTDGWEMHCFAKDDAARDLGTLLARGGMRVLGQQGPNGARISEVLDLMWKQGAPLMDAHRHNLGVRFVPGPDGAVPGQVVIFEFGASRECGITCRDIGSLDTDGVLPEAHPSPESA